MAELHCRPRIWRSRERLRLERFWRFCLEPAAPILRQLILLPTVAEVTGAKCAVAAQWLEKKSSSSSSSPRRLVDFGVIFLKTCETARACCREDDDKDKGKVHLVILVTMSKAAAPETLRAAGRDS